MTEQDALKTLESLLSDDPLSWSVQHAPEGSRQANALIEDAWESCECSGVMLLILSLTNDSDVEFIRDILEENACESINMGFGLTSDAEHCATVRYLYLAPTLDELAAKKPVQMKHRGWWSR